MTPIPGLNLDDLQTDFDRRFEGSQASIHKLRTADLATGEREKLESIERVRSQGIRARLRRLRSSQTQTDLLDLVNRFCTLGPSAILQVGAQRGGDFLLNQIRGRWAEQVCRAIEWPGFNIVDFGPSGAAMPGEEDYDRIVRTFREISLTEGKRPDLLAFSTTTWTQIGETAQGELAQWPLRPLRDDEWPLLQQCRCGIEVKNSTWHYETRRKSSPRPLSVTVKAEELDSLERWATQVGRPVVFVQVLFDEIYCMSFRRMQAAIANQFMYEAGDYISEVERSTGKLSHKFFLNDSRHLCARTVFPSQSEAVVSVLPDGNVIPYIRYQPARATDVRPDIIEREVCY